MKLPHLATRIFDTPLLIAPQKFEIILSVLAPKLGLIDRIVDRPSAASGERAARKPYEVTEDGIAVIPIEGTLVHKAYGLDALSGLRSYTDLQQEIEDAAADPAISAILLDVDSAGGEVAGVFDLADAIYAARQAKPIFAVANNDAFSAAYLLASSAERLYVSRTSGVGSIGVIVSHLDVSQADEKSGYRYTVVHAGARKADFNPHAPLNDDARAVLEAEVMRTYGLLVNAVARNRNRPESAIRATEAALYFGEEAIATRLADRMGTRQDALNALRRAVAHRKTAQQRSRTMQQEQIVKEAGNGTEAADAGDKRLTNQADTRPASEPAKPAPAEPVSTSSTELRQMATDLRKAGYDEAREIVELCALAGQPAQATILLARNATPAEARQHLLALRAAHDPVEIDSHVMPDTATPAAKQPLDSNPVVKAAERLAKRIS